jgi:hypothetical protein
MIQHPKRQRPDRRQARSIQNDNDLIAGKQEAEGIKLQNRLKKNQIEGPEKLEDGSRKMKCRCFHLYSDRFFSKQPTA